MKNSIKYSLLSLLAVSLSGCAFSRDALFPSLVGSDYQESAAVDSDMPNLGTTNFEPINISKGSNTGTFVGQKAASFRNDLSQLQGAIKTHNEELQKIRSSIVTNAQSYHKATGAMEAKLQVGTTPGNPQMYATLQSAQNNVQVMSANTIALNQLSARVTSDSTMTQNLLESIRSSYAISGAVDEDHRQLRILENETNQTAILINSILGEINLDAARQQQYVDTASSYLISLDSAIRQGNYGIGSAPYSYNNSTMPAALITPVRSSALAPSAATSSGKPLFTAKFNKSNVDYHSALKNAVDSAKAKKSSVIFDVVAISPSSASQASSTSARNNANQIFKEIIDMGVSADKVTISSRANSSVSAPEVQVFVR